MQLSTQSLIIYITNNCDYTPKRRETQPPIIALLKKRILLNILSKSCILYSLTQGQHAYDITKRNLKVPPKTASTRRYLQCVSFLCNLAQNLGTCELWFLFNNRCIIQSHHSENAKHNIGLLLHYRTSNHRSKYNSSHCSNDLDRHILTLCFSLLDK